MSVKDVVEYLEENGSFIVENWSIFAIWTLLCVLVCMFCFRRKIKKQRDLIAKQEEELSRLKQQIDSLDERAWLTASDVLPNGSSAEKISKGIRK